jgi:hypothetical protein
LVCVGFGRKEGRKEDRLPRFLGGGIVLAYALAL